MRIALFGPPGSGKGTQSRLLVERQQAVQISTGNLIREAMREGTDLGRVAEAFVVEGRLVPDELVRTLADKAITAQGFEAFVLDGYPRTVVQAEWLTEFLDKHSAPLEAVVSLAVSDERIVERVSKRLLHRATGEVYHTEFRPPPADLDPSELVQRRDDSAESIRRRLRVYHDQTTPVEEYFREAGLLEEVDGELQVEEVYELISNVIEKRTVHGRRVV